MRQDNGRFHKPPESNRGSARPELLIEEFFISIFTFCAAGLYNREK
jgi:hypothetical protein